MSGEQKLKDGDEVLFTCESTNSVELLFFTNHRQVYKSQGGLGYPHSFGGKNLLLFKI